MFYFDKKSLTLLTGDASAVSRFNLEDCNLTEGITKDISIKGCANFSSLAACDQEYDIINIERNVLRLGARPLSGDVCSAEKRPKSLGQPLVKEMR